MKTIFINGVEYEFMPELNGGYYDPLNGWHNIKNGRRVFNIDGNGKMFFNSI